LQGKGARKFALNLKPLNDIFKNFHRIIGLYIETQMVLHLKI
jgi:hypothetical protein